MEFFNGIELLKKMYDKLLTEVAKTYDLTLVEVKILMFLDNNKSDVAKDIVAGIQATKSHVSMATSDLEEKGYIEKVQDEKDRKQSHLQLTEKSSEVIKEGHQVNKKIREIMIEGLTEEEIKSLRETIGKMFKNVQEHI